MITDSFGDWESFMLSYGLKIWDEGDRDEAMAIADAMEEGREVALEQKCEEK